MNRRVMELAVIETATPNGLQLFDIIRYNLEDQKIANGAGVLGQFCVNIIE